MENQYSDISVQESIRDIRNQLRELKLSLQKPQQHDLIIDGEDVFPIETMDELMTFERELKRDADFRKSLVSTDLGLLIIFSFLRLN